MLCEAYLSHKKSGLSVSDLKTIQEMILQVFGKFDFPDGDVAAIVSLCGQDKKNEGEVINFSLLNQIGQCDYNIPASLEEITEAIQLYRSL
jgi:3-dehydroquinate synthase